MTEEQATLINYQLSVIVDLLARQQGIVLKFDPDTATYQDITPTRKHYTFFEGVLTEKQRVPTKEV